MAKLRQLEWHESGKKWRIEHGFTTDEWKMYAKWAHDAVIRTSIVYAITGFVCGHAFGELIRV